jgi:hypothetical protein
VGQQASPVLHSARRVSANCGCTVLVLVYYNGKVSLSSEGYELDKMEIYSAD